MEITWKRKEKERIKNKGKPLKRFSIKQQIEVKGYNWMENDESGDNHDNDMNQMWHTRQQEISEK